MTVSREAVAPHNTDGAPFSRNANADVTSRRTHVDGKPLSRNDSLWCDRVTAGNHRTLAFHNGGYFINQ